MTPDPCPDHSIPDLRMVEPPATRNPLPLPYPGPESTDTYRPTTYMPTISFPNADGSMPVVKPWMTAWFRRIADVSARAERDPAYKAYITSCGH